MLGACPDAPPGRGHESWSGRARRPHGPPAVVLLYAAVAAMVATIGAGPARAADPSNAASLERQVKIAFLYNFAKFVEWPRGSFAAAAAPLTVGVLGSDAFCLELERDMKGRSVGSHPIEVRRLATIEEARSVQILFLGTAGVPEIRRALAALESAPVLTVGDMPRFAARGGMISFTLEDNKVRFEINVAAARRAGLKISSKLLNVASALHDTVHAGF
jgi:hypothetical protein